MQNSNPGKTASVVSMFLLLAVSAWPTTGDAQLGRSSSSPPESILLRNVTLIDQEGESDDVVVNILIQDNDLDVVTQEEISASTVELALDAEQGILMGNLELGRPASFLILDGDPREDIQVLLDTATTVTFVIKQGEVIRNRLRRAFDAGEEPKRSGWLAYTPPPLALPTSYRDTTKWNRWETKYISGIFISALALDRQNWQGQDDDSEFQVGDLREFDGGDIRGFRFGVAGTLNFPQPWVYSVSWATNAFDKGFDIEEDDDWTFFDWRLDIPTFAGTTLSIGKQKEPISLERTMGMIYLPMQERSAVSDALLPSRNVGVVLSGTGFDQRISWAGGVFNDWLDTGDSPGDSATQVIGRLTWLPWMSPDESNLVHLGFGMRHTNAREGLQGLTEPEFDQSPNFVDTSLFEADSSLIYNLEASWRRGPVWVHGEYVLADVDAPDLEDPDFSGYHVTASWALTGEMRDYNRKSGIFNALPIARSVYQGGAGAWEVAARWSEIDLTDGLIEGGEMEILSLGLSWWLSPIFNINLNYRWITLDRKGVEGDSHGLNSRVTLLLE